LGDELTTVDCANTGQTNTFHGMFHYQSTTLEPMGFHYRFSRGDRVQIISGKFKGHTGTVDANVFQRSVDFPKDHLPCHHVLLDNHMVITINVNQVEPIEYGKTVPYNQQRERKSHF
jgi:ribosomal protein L24